jgi:hypothetical protein
MKYVFILLFTPFVSLSQKWQYQYAGNTFDGFKRIAIVNTTDVDGEILMLGVVNISDKFNLINGINSKDKNGIDNLSIRLILNNNIDPESILLAFDQDKTYYKLNFNYSDGIIYIKNAYSPDYNKYLSKTKIISLFKQKKSVHFRLEAYNTSYDYSFTLSGSTESINRVFNCSNCIDNGDVYDAYIELLYFTILFSKVNGSENYTEVAGACSKYLKKKYGEYFFTEVASIETDEQKELPNLIFKNKQGENICEIDKDVYLVNYLHFSGNIRAYGSNNKLLKDTSTLRLYYEAFQRYTNIVNINKISFDKFSNLKKSDLLIYYNEIKRNIQLLDYLRKDEDILYFYERNEYTFDVFLEAWGI